MQGGKGVLTGTSKQVAAILETACSLRSLTDGELAKTVRHAAMQQAEWRKTDSKNTSRVETGAGVVVMDTLRRVTMAAVCEAARRVLGFTLHQNQVEASLIMTSRCVVEMPTGEGKTLSAVLTAVWLGLGGEGVHILTFNDYLANRDFQWMGHICRLLGRTTGCVTGTCSKAERQKSLTKKTNEDTMNTT